MTITIEAPELEASLTMAAAEANMSVNQYAARILQWALTPNGDAEPDNPLRGSVLHYDLPLEPVALDDWETSSGDSLLQATKRTPTGYGKFAHIQTSSDEFAARKEEEKAREDRRNWTAS